MKSDTIADDQISIKLNKVADTSQADNQESLETCFVQQSLDIFLEESVWTPHGFDDDGD